MGKPPEGGAGGGARLRRGDSSRPGAGRPGEGARVELLGGFRVDLGDRELGPDDWPGRRPAELVQMLALAPGRRLTRDQVIERLWPQLEPEAGAANLRKAAYHARRALGDREAIVLRGGTVALFPAAEVEVDAELFEREAEAALASGDPGACTAVADRFGGELLPDVAYAEWTQEPRRRLWGLLVELLRAAGDWRRVIELEPTDEPAYRALIEAELERGRRHAAIRWYARLRASLARELGVAPGPKAQALYERCVAGLGVAEPDFVGRELELAEASAVFADGLKGEVSAIAISGPAGIGKSAFCRRLAALARERGWLVAATAATPWSDPHAPLVAAVEQLVGDRHDLLDGLSAATRSVLAELTPLAGPAPAIGLTRHKVIGALRRLLTAAAEAVDGRVMVIVDDAHAADDASIEVLRHLAASGGPFVLVVAARPGPAADPLASAIRALAAAGKATEIELGALDRDQAAALIELSAPARPEPGATARVLDLAEGNPFFILELASSVSAGGELEIPPTVWEAVANRFLDLDSGRIAMLERLAVAGGSLDLASVLGLTGLSEPEAFALLDDALAAGVLVVSGAGYRFRHELVRQALVERLPAHRRIAIHRDAARRLIAAGGPASRIARHWLDGERPDEALEWLLVAAREAVSVGAYADARRRLEPLLAHAPDHAEARALDAEALDALGDRRAPQAYEDAARLASGPTAQELLAKGALARLKAGDPPGALAVVEGTAPTTVAGRLAEALTLAGAAAVGHGDAELAAQKAAEARRLALELDDLGAVAEAAWAQSLAAHARGELADSLRAELGATRQLPELAIRVFDGYLCATERLLYGGSPAVAVEFAASLENAAQRLGAARGRGFAITLRGMATLLAGRLGEADQDLAAAAALHHELAAPAGEALALQQRAEVALYRGRLDEAEALIAAALAAARESGLEQHLLDRIYGTKLRIERGSEAALVAAVDDAEAAVRGPVESCPTCRLALTAPAAIAAARGGALDRARSYAELTETLTEVILPLPAKRAALDEVKGEVARAAGDEDEARHRFEQAAAGFGAAGQPLDAERCAILARGGGR